MPCYTFFVLPVVRCKGASLEARRGKKSEEVMLLRELSVCFDGKVRFIQMTKYFQKLVH